MPRGSDGSYSLPAGTLANTGETILVSQHNPPFLDVGQALTDSLDRNGSGGMLAPLNMNSHAIQNVTPGTNPNDVATVSQLTGGGGGGGGGVPVGSIVDYGGSAAPAGLLLCGGRTLNRTEYAELFAAIGTAFGAPSGSTFNLPDLRGRATAGVDFSVSGTASRLTTSMSPNGTTLGATGGTQAVALTTAQLATHTHTGSTSSAGAHTHTTMTGNSTLANAGAANAVVLDTIGNTSSAGDHTHTMSLDNAGSGESHPNVQPTILINKIIKATS